MSSSSFTSEEDFVAAYDQYADAIFRHCYLRLLRRERAKEMVLDAFTTLWRFIADGNRVDSMQLALYRISNELIDRETRDDVQQEAEGPPQELVAQFSVLQELAPKDRGIVILHYVDGFSLQEIGVIVGGAIQDHALALQNGTSLISSRYSA